MLVLFLSLQSNLSGFYDPCPEEEKMLRIRYLFRDAMHEVTYEDKEPVRIPKQCKHCTLFSQQSVPVLNLYVGFPLLTQSETTSFWDAANQISHVIAVL